MVSVIQVTLTSGRAGGKRREGEKRRNTQSWIILNADYIKIGSKTLILMTGKQN